MEKTNIEDLKAEADSLGIKYNARIGADSLKVKIEEFKNKPKEDEYNLDVEAERVNNRVKRPLNAKAEKRREIIKRSLKRSKVIIYNNDPREREMTTTFSSVRNSFFGDARVLPIGEEWWVQQMHIDNLRNIEITVFSKDKDGNSIARRSKKFTIDVLETDEEAAKARLNKEAKS
jgi:hypothetical protein